MEFGLSTVQIWDFIIALLKCGILLLICALPKVLPMLVFRRRWQMLCLRSGRSNLVLEGPCLQRGTWQDSSNSRRLCRFRGREEFSSKDWRFRQLWTNSPRPLTRIWVCCCSCCIWCTDNLKLLDFFQSLQMIRGRFSQSQKETSTLHFVFCLTPELSYWGNSVMILAAGIWCSTILLVYPGCHDWFFMFIFDLRAIWSVCRSSIPPTFFQWQRNQEIQAWLFFLPKKTVLHLFSCGFACSNQPVQDASQVQARGQSSQEGTAHGKGQGWGRRESSRAWRKEANCGEIWS